MQPSLYDSIIQVKKLPYLPDLGWNYIRCGTTSGDWEEEGKQWKRETKEDRLGHKETDRRRWKTQNRGRGS